MLSKWEKHERNTAAKGDMLWKICNQGSHIRRRFTILHQKERLTQTAILFPIQTTGRNTYKRSRLEPIVNRTLSQTFIANYEISSTLFDFRPPNIKTWTNWQSSFVSDIYLKFWKYLHFFIFSDPRVDLTEPTAISKWWQRPKRNSWARHLHCTLPTTLQLLSFLLNWWSSASHKSHLWRGGRTWYPDCNWNCTDCRTRHIGKI